GRPGGVLGAGAGPEPTRPRSGAGRWAPGARKMRAPARELFRDAAFPAADSSLLSSCSTPLAQLRGDITWRRPQEICKAPRLFADSPQEGPVRQGLLGDCWFLCACAALSRSRPLLHQVFPPGQPCWRDPEYRGAFTCRVWQFGHWVEVTIDDRLPCLAGRLCFSRCQSEDVFWLPLLEKVYAKLHGSYEHLWAGQVADALVDLTGGLAERWSLKDLARAGSQQDGHPAGGPEPRTCRQLLRLQDRCLISCSVLSPRPGASGLGEFHAFIVAEVRELRAPAGQPVLLLRIQNPWGRRCWQGPWREGGEGWSQVDAAEASGLLSRLQEGEFWVEEEEFLREFDEVTIGYPVSEAGHLQSLASGRELLHTQQLPGAWVKGQSAGGCRNNSGFPSNPKFWLRVSEPSEVYVAVLQRPPVPAADWAGRARALAGNHHAARSVAGSPGRACQAVGLHIWKVEKRRVSLPRVLSAPPAAGTPCHAYDREVHLRCELPPGHYLAVPSTFLKDAPGQFLLRVFSTGRVSLSAVRPATPSARPREVPPAGEWETVRLRGAWRAGQTAGGSRNFASFPTNPCFPLSVPEGAGVRSVRISLLQHCEGGQCLPIGFHVFQASAVGGPWAGAAPRRAAAGRAGAGRPWRLARVPPLRPSGKAGTGRVAGGQQEGDQGFVCGGRGHLGVGAPRRASAPAWPEGLSAASAQAPGRSAGSPGPAGRASCRTGMWSDPEAPSGQTAGGPGTTRRPAASALPPQVPPGGQGAPPPLLQEPVLSCVPHRYAQEVSRLCQLAAGAYCVVPSTYLPDTEGAFTVTVATRIDRRSLHSRETLGRPLQEASFVAVRRT
ncbi:Calpain-10, partial [Galemys pyrenaicus]